MDPGPSSTMDLRYIILFLLNLFLTFAEKYSVLKMDEENLVLNLVSLFVAMLFVLLFLFTPIELPICGGPITIRFGLCTVPLTILLVFSVTLTPLLFWLACLLIIPTAAWHGKFWGLFKRLFRGFSRALQRIPPIFIHIYRQRNSNPAAAVVTEVEIGEMEGSQVQSQQDAEQYSITIGDSCSPAAVVSEVEVGEMEGSQMQIPQEAERYSITIGDSCPPPTAAAATEDEVGEMEGSQMQSQMQSQQDAEQYSITIGDSCPVAAAAVTGVEFGEMEGSQMQIQLEEEQYSITVGDSRN